MLRRVPRVAVRHLDDVEARAREATGPLVLIFDVDNTLVPQGAPWEELGRVAHAVRDRFEAIESVQRVILLTNGAERGVPWMESRGNKPWTSRRRLGLDRSPIPEVWVTGDQILIDGVLAWRLRARFFHRVVDAGNEAAGQAMMRRIGPWVERLIFVDENVVP